MHAMVVSASLRRQSQRSSLELLRIHKMKPGTEKVLLKSGILLEACLQVHLRTFVRSNVERCMHFAQLQVCQCLTCPTSGNSGSPALSTDRQNIADPPFLSTMTLTESVEDIWCVIALQNKMYCSCLPFAECWESASLIALFLLL